MNDPQPEVVRAALARATHGDDALPAEAVEELAEDMAGTTESTETEAAVGLGRPVELPALSEAVPGRVALLGPVYAVLAVLMVPWTVYLALVLPGHQISEHYDFAWAGFDVGLLLSLGWTAVTVMRRATWLPIAASFTASLLLVDAWFDVITARRGSERWIAVGTAALLELPLAAVSLWLARNGQRVVLRLVLLRLWRRSPRTADSRTADSRTADSRTADSTTADSTSAAPSAAGGEAVG